MISKYCIFVLLTIFPILGYSQQTPPNILLIITDQHSGTIMSQKGYEHLSTPGIDKLAQHGVTFTRSYCTYPVCTSSRKSFMTGVMPSQAEDVTQHPSVGKKMAAAGYETIYYGKWHVGSTEMDEVKDWHGFETYIDGRNDSDISKWSTDFIKQTHEKPFFMVTSFLNPHDCCELARNLSGENDNYHDGDVGALDVDTSLCPPLPHNFAIPENEAEGFSARRNQDPGDKYWDSNPYKLWTETEWRRYMWGYDRLVEKVDQHIETIYDALDAENLLDNTVIIYTSDHGDGHASHQWTQKKTFYEEAVNIPFVVSWKGKTKAGVIDSTLLISNGLDIVPTILELAGITPLPTMHGDNILPNALLTPGVEPLVKRDYVVSEIVQTVQKSNFPGSYNGRMVVTDKFKYILFDKGANKEQLFDLENDPGELNPVHDNPAYNDELKACREMLRDWVSKTGDRFDVDAAIYSLKYHARRLNNGQPIVTQQMFTDLGAEKEGENINGPCMIRVPDWIAPENRAHPDAQYYCYFAHHDGQYIRMAWAANIEGPYHLYQTGSGVPIGNRGVLDNGNKDIKLNNGITIENNHLASPNAHVDHENQQIILYFHNGPSVFVNGNELNSQLTWVSTSPNGLEFYDNIQPVYLGNSYFSVFEYEDELYALDNGANPYKALDALNPWAPPAGHNFADGLWEKLSFNPFQNDITEYEGLSSDALRVRHASTAVIDDELHVFYSRRGDLMENIQMSVIDLSKNDWTQWDASYPPSTLLMAQPGWEGGDISTRNSETSSAPENVNQLRDPFVFTDIDSAKYLIYTGRGEDALGIASLSEAHMDVIKLNPVKDAFVRAGNDADTNYGSEKEMWLSAKNIQDSSVAYLEFDLEDKGKVDQAIVRMYSNSSVAGQVSIFQTESNWNEETITWNNAPSQGKPIAANNISSKKQYYEWDITTLINEISGTSVSLVFSNKSTNGETIKFESKEGTNCPELLLVTSNTEYLTHPLAPLAFNASAISTTEINLNWIQNSINEDGFKIERKDGNGSFNEIAIVDAGTTQYTDTGLTDSTTYTYRILAFNNQGNSNYSDEATATTLSSNSQTISYYVDEDTYVRGGSYDDTNYGSAIDLIVKTGSQETFFRRTLLKFDFSSEPLEAKHVARAVLKLYTNKAKPCNITAAEIGDNWSENSATWNNIPDPGNELITTEVSSANKYYEWDITSYLKNQFSEDKIVSVFLTDRKAAGENIEFNSKETGENIPEIEITTIGNITNTTNLITYNPKVKAYPNPLNGDILYVQMNGIDKQNKVEIAITSLLGKTVVTTHANETSNIQINTNGKLQKGMYLITIQSGSFISTSKLIVN